MELDLTPLANAVARLAEGLERFRSQPGDTQLRDGLIQRFEFTYEQSHKMLRRYLSLASSSPHEFDQADFSSLIRAGNEQDLLQGDWSTWKTYREMRGKTSHAYDEGIAQEVVKGIPNFLREAQHLLDRLRKKLG